MLCELIIENVAVIEKANINFANGFTCLTGETGAGKSIIVDSINAILGDRISKNIVRNGANKAVITAVFEDINENLIKKAEEFDIDISSDCIITRQVTQEGKSTARINGMPAPLSVIKDIFQDIITIHGQHDNQSLLNSQKHISILDGFGVGEFVKLEYVKFYNEYTAINNEIKKLENIDKESEENLDLLSFQIKEIEEADLSSEEEQDLVKAKKKILDFQKIMQGANSAYTLLAGEDEVKGAVSAIDFASSELFQVLEYDEKLKEVSEKLIEAQNIVSDALFALKNYLDDFDVDVDDIDKIEERLDLYYRLKRKYGPETSDVLTMLKTSKEKLKTINFLEEELDNLYEKQEKLLPKLKKSAENLTQNRTEIFNKFQKQIKTALEFLNMPAVDLILSIKDKNYSKSGKDDIEFLIVTNKGETAKPLSKIASGGELSRIMLAIKSVLAETDETSTLIFDEIDAGVSGSAAFKIGKLLKDTAKGKQIFCVTHSAQIAAFSDNHLLIKKTSDDKATYTNVSALSESQREMEIARIISGDNITNTSLENAKEMILNTKKS